MELNVTPPAWKDTLPENQPAPITMRFRTHRAWPEEHPKTVLFELRGRGALAISTFELRVAITSQELADVEDLAYGWVHKRAGQHCITFKDDQKAQMLDGKTFGIRGEITATATYLGQEKTKFSVIGVHQHMPEHVIRGILSEFLEDADTCELYPKNRWTMHIQSGATKTKPVKIPHHVEITQPGGVTHKLQVSIPGRPQICNICESGTHWPNRCDQRQQQRDNRKERLEDIQRHGTLVKDHPELNDRPAATEDERDLDNMIARARQQREKDERDEDARIENELARMEAEKLAKEAEDAAKKKKSEEDASNQQIQNELESSFSTALEATLRDSLEKTKKKVSEMKKRNEDKDSEARAKKKKEIAGDKRKGKKKGKKTSPKIKGRGFHDTQEEALLEARQEETSRASQGEQSAAVRERQPEESEEEDDMAEFSESEEESDMGLPPTDEESSEANEIQNITSDAEYLTNLLNPSSSTPYKGPAPEPEIGFKRSEPDSHNSSGAANSPKKNRMDQPATHNIRGGVIQCDSSPLQSETNEKQSSDNTFSDIDNDPSLRDNEEEVGGHH